MPSPSKYHPDGSLYGQLHRRPVSAERYIVRGYFNPRLSFQWYSEPRCKPFDVGIKKANKAAAAQGHKFDKAAFLRSLI